MPVSVGSGNREIENRAAVRGNANKRLTTANLSVGLGILPGMGSMNEIEQPHDVLVAVEPVLSEQELDRVRRNVIAAKAPNTRRAYSQDWRRFESWCGSAGRQAVPAHPLTVSAYLTEAADALDSQGHHTYSADTLGRWAAAIAYRHRAAGLPSPCSASVASEALAGIRRDTTRRRRRARRAAPLLTGDIRDLVAVPRVDTTTVARRLAALRDPALILLAFPGALRASELCQRRAVDIRQHRLDGLHIVIEQSKGDQESAVTVPVPRASDPAVCPPCAWVRWRAVLTAQSSGGRGAVKLHLDRDNPADPFDHHICRGELTELPQQMPAFCSIDRHGNLSTGRALGAESLGDILRRHLRALGYTTAEIKTFSGHSLRAGFVTDSIRAGATERQIMRQTRHKSEAMVRRYQREDAPLADNAVTLLPLL
ncbi:recombinase [Nocardia sp. NPDC056952]|uniref:recombinase n=1 Tax=Nocardia sp. NPDC056952 TaxID=3345979 RepID=UPI003630CA91